MGCADDLDPSLRDVADTQPQVSPTSAIGHAMIESSQQPGPDLLFVYGALRRGYALHHHLRRLRAEFVSPGKVHAELSTLGNFPGARRSNKLGRIVQGELYRLHELERSLKVLDHAEGFSPRTPEKGIFQRATANIILPNRERRLAWIYWYRS